MYKFIRSYLKRKSSNIPYGHVDIQETTLKDLFANYIDGWIELSNPALTQNVFLPLDNLRRDNVPIRLDLSFNRFLGSLGNLSLDTVDDEPQYHTGLVKARDAVLAGYAVNMCEPNQSPDTGGVITNKTNLFITKSFGDITVLNNKTLITVNGMVHRSFPRRGGLEVIDGGKSWLHARECLCGILSFEEVGNLIQVPIEADKIHRPTPATPHANSVIVDLDVSLVNKTVMLVLGGYLYVQPEWLKIVSAENGTIKMDLQALDLPTCFMNSYDLIDIENLGFSKAELDKTSGTIAVQKATSDVVVKKWLTCAQSFVVIVDTPVLTVQTRSLHHTGVYGSYEYHENPYLPLKDHYGRLSEYWVKRQNEAWIVQMTKPIYSSRIDYTTAPGTLEFANKTTAYNSEWARAPKFLEITGTRPLG